MSQSEQSDHGSMPQSTGAEPWIDGYRERVLIGKRAETAESYLRVLRHLTRWVSKRSGQFHPSLLTPEAVAAYLGEMAAIYSPSHLKRVKSVLSGFGLWLIALGDLTADPTRGISIAGRPSAAPARLAQEQRAALGSLVERTADARGRAIFFLGYAAGCRVSEVSHLLLEHTAVDAQEGRLRVAVPGGNERIILLSNEARDPLFAYLTSGKRAQSAYVFTSQRERETAPRGDMDGWRLGESAIHAWFQQLREAATPEEWALIGGLTFHNLRRDFESRAREAGFTEDELAAYLGRMHKRGPTAGKAPGSRSVVAPEQLRGKLHALKTT
jgi:site-specific recombinase XerD